VRRELIATALVALLGAVPAFAEGPYLVKDIEPLSQNGDSNPEEFFSFENGVSLLGPRRSDLSGQG
jgi:hypothetical protein